MNSLLKTNDYIGLVANSNGIDIANKDKIDTLIACLKELGLNPLLSSILNNLSLLLINHVLPNIA